MKFDECLGVGDVVRTLKQKGIAPSENALVGTVYPVHTGVEDQSWGSYHYKTWRNGKMVVATKKSVLYNGRRIMTPQGTLGVDINDNDLRDDHRPFDSERECLDWVYDKFFNVFGPRGYDVIGELFFNNRGYKRIHGPKVNVAIPNHTGHAHVGFIRGRWL